MSKRSRAETDLNCLNPTAQLWATHTYGVTCAKRAEKKKCEEFKRMMEDKHLDFERGMKEYEETETKRTVEATRKLVLMEECLEDLEDHSHGGELCSDISCYQRTHALTNLANINDGIPQDKVPAHFVDVAAPSTPPFPEDFGTEIDDDDDDDDDDEHFDWCDKHAECERCCKAGECTTKGGRATRTAEYFVFCIFCLGSTSPDPMWSKCVLEKFNAQKAEAAE